MACVTLYIISFSGFFLSVVVLRSPTLFIVHNPKIMNLLGIGIFYYLRYLYIWGDIKVLRSRIFLITVRKAVRADEQFSRRVFNM